MNPQMIGPAAAPTADIAITNPKALVRSDSSGKFDITSVSAAGAISAAPRPSRTDQPSIITQRFQLSAVTSAPIP